MASSLPGLELSFFILFIFVGKKYYLKNIYLNQNELLKTSGLMASESSVIDFEIDEYIKNDLTNLISKVDDYNSIDDDLEKD